MGAANEIIVKMTVQTAKALEQFETFLSHTGEGLSHLAHLGGLGFLFSSGAIIAGFEELARHSFEFADQMGKVAKSVGVTVEEMSGLAYAAQRDDVSLEQLKTGLKKFSEYLVKSGQDAHSLKDALIEQSRIFQGMPDGAGKAALAVERFGRAGAGLIPLLDQGPEKMQEMIERGTMLSGVNDHLAEVSDNFNNALRDLKIAAQGFAGSLGSTLLPMLTKLLDKMTTIVATAREGLKFWPFGTSGLFDQVWNSLTKSLDQASDNVFGKEEPAMDKAAYEAKKKQIEYDLKASEIIIAEGELKDKYGTDAIQMQKVLNQEYGSQIKLLEKLMDLNDKAIGSGVLSREEGKSSNQGLDLKRVKTQGKQQPMGIGDNVMEAWSTMVKGWDTIAHQIAKGFTTIIGGAVKSISNGITGLIMGTKTWGQALSEIGTNILTTVIESIVEMGVKWVLTHVVMSAALSAFHALSDALGWTSAESVVAQETVKAPLLAENAVNASISSYGAASIAGVIALVAAIGIGIAAATGAFRERGGPVSAGQPYIVGEKRPELFVPSQSGFIMPSVPSQAPGGGFGGGNHTSIHVNHFNDEASLNKHLRENPDAHHILIDKMKKNAHVVSARV